MVQDVNFEDLIDPDRLLTCDDDLAANGTEGAREAAQSTTENTKLATFDNIPVVKDASSSSSSTSAASKVVGAFRFVATISRVFKKKRYEGYEVAKQNP